MGRHQWTVELDGARHDVELRLGYFSARREVLVDGQGVLSVVPGWNAVSYWQMSTEHPFQIDGHAAAVRIRPGSFFYEADLVVDGRSTETGQEAGPLPAPKWYPRTPGLETTPKSGGRSMQWIGLALTMLLVFAVPAYYGARELRFAMEGQDTAGVVASHYETASRNGPSQHLRYTFTVEGRRYLGDQPVSYPLYFELADGSAATVQYLGSDPTVSRIDREIDFRSFWIYGGIGLLVVASLVVPILVQRRRRKLETALVGAGALTSAEVTSLEHRVHRDTDHWLVGYRYADDLGVPRSGTATLDDGGPPRWRPGDRARIEFDPHHPDRSVWLG